MNEIVMQGRERYRNFRRDMHEPVSHIYTPDNMEAWCFWNTLFTDTLVEMQRALSMQTKAIKSGVYKSTGPRCLCGTFEHCEHAGSKQPPDTSHYTPADYGRSIEIPVSVIRNQREFEEET